MAYRKIAPTELFNGYQILKDNVLILKNDGTVEALLPLADAGEGIQQVEGLLSPGFINCHCHLELSHMKGRIPEGTGLVDFVFKIVTGRSASDEEIMDAIALAEKEMKEGGIVAVGDICNNAVTLPQRQKSNLHYYNFIEASGWLPAVSAARLERVKSISHAYLHGNWQTASTVSIVPHAPYSVSENLWQAIQPYFAGRTVSIHNQETRFEDEFFLQGTGDFQRMYQLMNLDNSHHLPSGKSSLQSYFDKLLGAERILLVHNTFTREEDMLYVKQKTTGPEHRNAQFATAYPPTFFCLCVNANQYIESALPPIELLRRHQCTIVLGTDSLASNWSLRILDEMKTIQKHFPQIPLEEVLCWATSNGAKALGMDTFLGSFEKGKKPGAVLIDPLSLTVKQVF